MHFVILWRTRFVILGPRPRYQSTLRRMARLSSPIGVLAFPSQDRARIFERFWRGRSTATTGAGLGLAIVAEIVRAHGGTIEVGDSPGGGAAFSLHLPHHITPKRVASPPTSRPTDHRRFVTFFTTTISGLSLAALLCTTNRLGARTCTLVAGEMDKIRGDDPGFTGLKQCRSASLDFPR